MEESPLTSCLRPLWMGSKLTIAGNSERLTHSACAYERDYIEKVGLKKCLRKSYPKQEIDSNRAEATRSLNDKWNDRSR